jgi:hypothetical protein
VDVMLTGTGNKKEVLYLLSFNLLLGNSINRKKIPT